MYWCFIRVRILFPCPLVPPSLLLILPHLLLHGPVVAGVVGIGTGLLSFQFVISVDSVQVLLLVHFHHICLLFLLPFVSRHNLLLVLLLAIHILIILLLRFLVLLLLRRLLLQAFSCFLFLLYFLFFTSIVLFNSLAGTGSHDAGL